MRPPEPDPPYPLNKRDLDRIVDEWMPRAAKIALKANYSFPGIEEDDWRAEAYRVLVTAIKKWKPNPNVPFAAYVTREIRFGLSAAGKLQTWKKRHLGESLEDAYIDWSDGHTETASNTVTGQQHNEWQPGNSDLDVWKAFDVLPAEEKLILHLYYCQEQSDPEIASKLHFSVFKVNQRRCAALDALRDILNLNDAPRSNARKRTCLIEALTRKNT